MFFIWFCSGRGRESARRREGGGVDFFVEKPRRGGGAEGPGVCLRRIGEFGGGGLNIFFRGRNVHHVWH